MASDDSYDFYCEVALKPNADIDKVYESDSVLAFHHTNPSFEKHVVVIPKKHVKDLRNTKDTELFGEMLRVASDILGEWDKAEIDKEGARIVSNLGKFQDTPHLHLHVILGKKI